VRYTLRERKFQGTKVPRSQSSIVLSFPGAKRPGGERARERIGRERKFQGARRPGSEKAREQKFQGANWPGFYWPIRSGERMGPGAKRLGTSSPVTLVNSMKFHPGSLFTIPYIHMHICDI